MSMSVTSAGVSKVIDCASSLAWSPGNSGPSQTMQYSPPSAPVGLLRRDRERGFAARRGSDAGGVQPPLLGFDMAEAPEAVAEPAALDPFGKAPRLPRLHHIIAVVRIARDAGRGVLQPLVPPAQRLLQETDARGRHGEVRIFVRPWSDDGLAGGAQALHQARHGVGIGIVPAADHQCRRFDRGEVLAHGTVLPVFVAMRVREPGDDEEGPFSSRSIHIWRQRSPTISGSGGREE